MMHNISLKRYNTLRLDSYAELCVYPFNEKGVKEIFTKFKKQKIIIIGRGSNLLLSQKYYDEDYVFLNLKLMDEIFINVNGSLHADAGATLSSLAWFALENNVAGFEFLEDIPGTVGGAIIMNAGTYKDNISQLILSITYYDILNDIIVNKKVSTTDFLTRKSKWSNGNYLILSCELLVKQGDYIKSLENLLAIKMDRYLKQPRNFPNAGSVFKRPKIDGKEVQVWKLINDCGLCGLTMNGAMISHKHTGFIINKGNATYEDIIFLIKTTKLKVKEKYNIELELEWKII